MTGEKTVVERTYTNTEMTENLHEILRKCVHAYVTLEEVVIVFLHMPLQAASSAEDIQAYGALCSRRPSLARSERAEKWS